MKPALLMLLALLSGCGQYAPSRVEARVVIHYCTELGAPPGSPNYWQCVHDKQEADAAGRPIVARVGY